MYLRGPESITYRVRDTKLVELVLQKMKKYKRVIVDV